MSRTFAVLSVLAVVAAVLGAWIPGAGQLLPGYWPVLAHAVVFAGVAVLVMLALYGQEHSAGITVVSVGVLGLIIELGQLFIPARTFAVPDLIANVAGAIAGVVLVVSGKWLARFFAQPEGDT